MIKTNETIFLTKIAIVKRRVIVYNHVTEVLICSEPCIRTNTRLWIYSAKTYGDGPFLKIRVYLISRFFSIRENRENFMLAKYTWFTVFSFVEPQPYDLATKV